MVEEEMTPRNTNNFADDEFGFVYDEPCKKKDKWIKIGDGVYQKIRLSYKPKKKSTKKRKPKKEIKKHTNNRSKGYRINYDDYCLGSGSSSKGPWK